MNNALSMCSDVINGLSSNIFDEIRHPFVMRFQKVFKAFIDVVAGKLLLNFQTVVPIKVKLAA